MLGDDAVALADGLRAPAHARAWFAERAAGLPEPLVDDTQLVISELVTNAVRHGGCDRIRLRVRPAEGGIRVEVFDSGGDLPAEPEARPALDRPSGRGLLIVAVPAHAWGVEPAPAGAGKTVWAHLLG